MSDWNKKVIDEFRANGGQVGGHYAGWDLLLLHTIGARSGLARITPVVCMADGDRYVIIASKAGAPSHPAWYHNLVANPDVEVEVGTERIAARATVAVEPERAELYARMAADYPFFSEYAKKTTRTIPVVILNRRS